MTLTISQWHQRYQQQAQWTQNLRKYIYDQIGIQKAHKILDIGCGTGVLEDELNRHPSAHIFGLDIDLNALRIAQGYAQNSIYTNGDCLQLPYRSRTFDVTMCHFLLLWVKEPLNAVREMARVTQPNGFILALAEPDYGGRIDFPPELSQIGTWQCEALKEQGANPYMGRELRSVFSRAGLVDNKVGVLGGQWEEKITKQEIELEWEVIQSDLHQINEFIMQEEKLKALELVSRQARQRILFVPTFYAFGMVIG
jgi:ubiquinone/menaquinone biosynthesis C-methylase UbiE